jgi:hypothetical protein
MTLPEPKLSLDLDGDDLVLRRVDTNGTTTIRISETDVNTLAQSVPALQQQVLSWRTRDGDSHGEVSGIQVAQVVLRNESLGQAILMTLFQPGSYGTTFAISREIVELLIERLPVHLARMTAADPTKQ